MMVIVTTERASNLTPIESLENVQLVEELQPKTEGLLPGL
jgi:hypothetical protein